MCIGILPLHSTKRVPDIIKLLPDSVANQIAAGEVVQRPASCVKELLENSVDSGATEIRLIIKDGGCTFIQVADNGKGMSETDARMCWERHATSKISSAHDLFKISSFGFRGEALASIAAVAQVEMKSKKEEDNTGILIRIEGSQVLEQYPVSCSTGTTITVKNLFYNIPARRNFLKSIPVETRHIIEEFTRISMAYPEVAFTMLNGENEVYRLSKSSLRERIAALINKPTKDLIEVNEPGELVAFNGFVGSPETAKRSRGDQYLYVNNRFIKSSYLNHAITSAFEGLMSSEQFPLYVINLQIDPSRIDINVHPTKTEIKFDDERTVYQLLKASVRKALGQYAMVPDTEIFDPRIYHPVFSKSETHATSIPEIPKVKTNPRFNPFSGDNRNNNSKYWEKMFQHLDTPFESENNEITYTEHTQSNLFVSPDPESELPKALGQLSLKYIIAQRSQELILIDLKPAHERILYEKLKKSNSQQNKAIQQLLFPRTLELSTEDFSLVCELMEEINLLGFDISVFGKNTIIINGAPADGVKGNENSMLEGLIKDYKTNQQKLHLEPRENLLRSTASSLAVSKVLRLTIEEMDSMILQLFACEEPGICPNGKPVFINFPVEKINELFLRKI